MKSIEKYTIITIVLAAFISFVMKILEVTLDIDLQIRWGVNISLFLLIVLGLFYTIKVKPLLYRIIFIGLMVSAFGYLALINRIPSASLARMVGWFTYGILAINFLRKSKGMESLKKINFIVLSSLLLLLIATMFLHGYSLDNVFSIIHHNLNYVILGIILSIKLRNIDLSFEEGKTLTYLALLTIYPIIINVLSMLKVIE